VMRVVKLAGFKFSSVTLLMIQLIGLDVGHTKQQHSHSQGFTHWAYYITAVL